MRRKSLPLLLCGFSKIFVCTGLWNKRNYNRELLITCCASRIGSCGTQRTVRTHSLLKSAARRSLRSLEVPNKKLAINAHLMPTLFYNALRKQQVFRFTTSALRGLLRIFSTTLLFSTVLGLASCGVLPVNQEPSPHGESNSPEPTGTGPSFTFIPSQARLQAIALTELPGYGEDNHLEAWPALLKSCEKLPLQGTMPRLSVVAWQRVCNEARTLFVSEANVRAFFLQHFEAWAVSGADGKSEGVLTGYYEPFLKASLTRRPPFVVPLYGPPDDLLTRTINGERVRGRMHNGQFVPFYTRAELTPVHGASVASLRGKEIAWLEDVVDAFFLQVQGSGRLLMPDGKIMRAAFADLNGHPYKSIGRTLFERGELKSLDEASMQGIKAWTRANPHRVQELLNTNPSFVFFKLVPATQEGPIGSLNVPLTERRSLAVDPRYVPLGAPVWMSAQHRGRTLNQLALAQDTGTAIKGEVRADYYWGSGERAGEEAGRMKAALRLWILWPKVKIPGSS